MSSETLQTLFCLARLFVDTIGIACIFVVFVNGIASMLDN